ncbi:MAG: endonuclease Q family protein [archaeon]
MDKGIIADFHIHSRYSRATSKNITFDNLVKYARIKGVDMLGTGDFTHPLWIKELKEKLKHNGSGVYYYQDFPFIFSTELSLVFSEAGKGRRVHIVILAPSLETAEQINSWLLTKGRLDYDGRPIFGMSCIELAENLFKIDRDIEIIPAHAWTPWFGIFGSMSGFDSLKEAFKEYTGKIHAIETGMSSNPAMNWRLSELNEKSLVSFSDAHSFWPFRLGREATIFSGKVNEEVSYKDILKQIRDNELLGTIETDPAYGKYHYDGHRLCNFSCSPAEALKLKDICPVCHKTMTIGVEHRVEELANHPAGFKPRNAKQFYSLLPLHELIAAAKASTLSSKKVWEEYNKLINAFGSEFNILLDAEKEKLARVTDKKLVDIILLNREGKIKVKPGFDGVYGEAMLQEKQAKLL